MTRLTVSDEQVREFERHGYVVARQLFDRVEVAGLRRYAKSDSVLEDESYVRRDAAGAETRLAVRNELDDASPYTAIVRSQRVAGSMARLLDDEVYHYHHKMIMKEPQVGGAWEWHQDYGYWYDFGCLFPDMASCMLAVDRATKANGCLQVLRGSHKMGRVEHGKTGGQVGADPVRVAAALARLELVYCEMESGDALFFHSNLLHRSDPNTSAEPRWSLICCYNTRHNDPFIENGRHPNYSSLDVWLDARVREFIVDGGQR